MASNYPTSLDTFSNPSGTDSLNSPSHSLQHADINDAVEAIEAKIGIGDSPAGSATVGQVLTAQGGGTAIWATPALVHINTTTFSAVASQEVDSVFSATYDNYEIKVNITAASATDALLNLYFRNSTPADVTTNYSNERLQVNSTFVQGLSETNSWGAVSTTYPTWSNYNISVYNPFLTRFTTWNAIGNYRANNGNPFFQIRGGTQASTTSMQGIKIYPASGTISGTISIYGVKK